MRRSAIRLGVGTAVVAAALATAVGVAGAGQPNNQACVGESLSVLASDQPGPGEFGQAVTEFAQAPDGFGLGNNIQFLQAGLVPDTLVPNTCNDPN